jgi:adenosylmethionine-8-amino-7-oxononanoate aminotransferase
MIYMTPALSITPEELQTLCEATVRTVREWSAWSKSM